jgi:hypothetical protein
MNGYRRRLFESAKLIENEICSDPRRPISDHDRQIFDLASIIDSVRHEEREACAAMVSIKATMMLEWNPKTKMYDLESSESQLLKRVASDIRNRENAIK